MNQVKKQKYNLQFFLGTFLLFLSLSFSICAQDFIFKSNDKQKEGYFGQNINNFVFDGNILVDNDVFLENINKNKTSKKKRYIFDKGQKSNDVFSFKSNFQDPKNIFNSNPHNPDLGSGFGKWRTPPVPKIRQQKNQSIQFQNQLSKVEKIIEARTKTVGYYDELIMGKAFIEQTKVQLEAVTDEKRAVKPHIDNLANRISDATSLIEAMQKRKDVVEELYLQATAENATPSQINDAHYKLFEYLEEYGLSLFEEVQTLTLTGIILGSEVVLEINQAGIDRQNAMTKRLGDITNPQKALGFYSSLKYYTADEYIRKWGSAQDIADLDSGNKTAEQIMAGIPANKVLLMGISDSEYKYDNVSKTIDDLEVTYSDKVMGSHDNDYLNFNYSKGKDDNNVEVAFFEGELDYLRFGKWNDLNPSATDSSEVNDWYYVFGRVTPNVDIPISGTATYNGKVVGSSYHPSGISGATESNINILGDMSLTADFANKTISGSFSNVGHSQIYGQQNSDFNWNAASLSGNWMGNDIKGSITTNNNMDGKFNAAFFGVGADSAKEIGGNWNVINGNYVATGVMAGEKLP